MSFPSISFGTQCTVNTPRYAPSSTIAQDIDDSNGYEFTSTVKKWLKTLICGYNSWKNNGTYKERAIKALIRLIQAYQNAGSYSAAKSIYEALFNGRGGGGSYDSFARAIRSRYGGRIPLPGWLTRLGLRRMYAGIQAGLGNYGPMLALARQFFSSGISQSEIRTNGYDLSIEPRIKWAEIYARRSPSAVLNSQRIKQLKQVVTDCSKSPSPRQTRQAQRVYRRLIEAFARAYHNSYKYDDADKLFRALLGKGSLPSQFAISGRYTPINKSSSILSEFCWNLIDWGGNGHINEALQESIRNLNRGVQFTKVLISALDKRIKTAGEMSRASLNDRMVLAAVLKQTLDRRISSRYRSHWQPMFKAAQRMGIILQSVRRYGNTKQRLWLAGVLDSIGETLKRSGRPKSEYERYKNLAAAEYKACEQPIIRSIVRSRRSRRRLGNYIRLANIYMVMGNFFNRAKNKKFARICWQRAIAIYRGIFYGAKSASNPRGVNLSANIFQAQNLDGFQLQNIRYVMRSLVRYNRRLRATIFNRRMEKTKLESYLNLADLIRRTKMEYDKTKTPQRNLVRILISYKEIASPSAPLGYFHIVLRGSIAKLKTKATNGLREARKTLARAYVKAKRFDLAIRLFSSNISQILSNLPSKSNGVEREEALTAALGNILELAWLFGERAYSIRDYPGKRADIKADYLRATALVQALISGRVNLQDARFASIRGLLTLGIKHRKELTSIQVLTRVESSPSKLRLTLANYLKGAGVHTEVLLIKTIKEYDRVAKAVRKDPLFSSEVKYEKVGALIYLAKIKIKQGKNSEAKTRLNEAVKLARESLLELLKHPRNVEMIYKALSAYLWALGVRGGFLKKCGNISTAHKDFMHAAALLEAFIYGKKNFQYPETENIAKLSKVLLKASVEDKRPKASLQLDLAAIYKAAHSGHEQIEDRVKTLLKAISEYRKVSGLSPAKMGSAKVGLAEALIMRGIFFKDEGEDEEAAKRFKKAIQICSSVLAVLNGTKNIHKIPEGMADLKAINTLIWALNNLKHYSITLLFCRALLFPKDGVKVAPKVAALAQRLKIKLSEILGFIKRSRNILLHPVVLEEMGLSIWNLRSTYIGTLQAAKWHKTAIDQIKKYITEITKKPENQRSLVEKRFLAQAYSALGDIYCWSMAESALAKGNYSRAKENHNKAKESYRKAIAIAKTFGSEDRGMVKIIRKANFGLAHIYFKQGDYKQAKRILIGILRDIGRPKRADIEDVIKVNHVLGNIYTYYNVKNSKQARHYYFRAISFLTKAEKSGANIRRLAEIHKSIGDTYRLLDKDYKQALSYYQTSLVLVRDRSDKESKRITAQNYSAIADIHLKRRKIDKAASFLSKARRLAIEVNAKDVVNEVDQNRVELRRLRKQGMHSIGFSATHISERYKDRTTKGWLYNFSAGLNVGRRLRIENLGITFGSLNRGYPVDKNSQDCGGNPIDKNCSGLLRLKSNMSYTFGLSPRFIWSGKYLNFRFNPRFEYSQTRFTTYSYNWNEYCSTYWNRTANKNNTLNTFLFGLNLGLDLKFTSNRWLIMPYANLGFSYLATSGQNAREAEKVSNQETISAYETWIAEDSNFYDSGTDPTTGECMGIAGNGVDDRQDVINAARDRLKKLDKKEGHHYSVNGSFGLRFVSPAYRLGNSARLKFSFFGGFTGAYDNISPTAGGFWPLEGVDPRRYAGTFGGGLELFFGNAFRWKAGLAFAYERGNYENFNFRLTLGRIARKWGLEAFLGWNRFRQESNDTSSDSVNFGLIFRF